MDEPILQRIQQHSEPLAMSVVGACITPIHSKMPETVVGLRPFPRNDPRPSVKGKENDRRKFRCPPG